jgi:hypothetical protein
VFALLALACLPGLALADSSGIQYQDAAPTVPDKSDKAGSSGAGGVNAGGQSSTDSGSGSSGGSATDGSSSGGDDDKSGGAAGKAGDDNGQGSQGGGAAGKAGVGDAHKLGTADTASIAHDGGSSPLVPILIALAVLAAISIGVVTMRRRNQSGGNPGAKSPPVSPEAG